MRDNCEVQKLIEQLVRSMAETMTTLSRLEARELDEVSGHPCAMGGSVRKLLVHNIAHDRMHAGQIHEKRWALDGMLRRSAAAAGGAGPGARRSHRGGDRPAG